MRRRQMVATAGSLLVTGVLMGCGTNQSQQTTDEPTVAGAGSETGGDTNGESGGDGGGGGDDSSPPDESGAEGLLLDQQVRMQQGGDGLGPGCSVEEGAPDGFQSDPGVWLNSLYSPTSYPHISVLCLRGFSPGSPIAVEVSGAGFSFHTTVQPVDGPPEADSDSLGYEEEGPETLFVEGASLNVYTRGYGDSELSGPPGSMASEMWEFLPPPDVREAIATDQTITLTATQADLTATGEQPVVTPTSPTYYTAHVPTTMLVVEGFEAGAQVPIGLYLADVDNGTATLVETAGTVTMPQSRVTTFAIPADSLSDQPGGTYCLMPPLGGADGDCDTFDH